MIEVQNRNIHRIKIKVSTIVRLMMLSFVLIILYRIPRTFGVMTIYESSYPTRTIGSSYVIYILTVFDVIVMVLGAFTCLRTRGCRVRFEPILLIIVIYNLLRYVLEDSNIFTLDSFEVLFAFMVSLSCGAITIYYFKRLKEIEFVFIIIVSICFVTQILYVFYNISSDGTGYGCLGLSSGGLGLLYCSFIVVLLHSSVTRQVIKTIFIAIAVVGILLTGSRVNMLLLFIFFAYHIIVDLQVTSRKKWLLLGIGLIALYILTTTQSAITVYSSKKITSLLNLLDGNVIKNLFGDQSMKERILSWQCALQIIGSNPLGISCGAKDLMNRMFFLGATTFPHSYLLCYYCLFGIGGLIIFICFVNQRVKAKNNKRIRPISSLMIIALTVYGGITTEYLLFYWFFMIYTYMKTSNLLVLKNVEYLEET